MLLAQKRNTEVTMKRNLLGHWSNGKRPATGRPRRSRHGVAAAAVLVASLSCVAFVSLYRAPTPVDAFAALGATMADSANVFDRV